MTCRLTSAAITVDNRCMASLPAIRTFAGMHRIAPPKPAAPKRVTELDDKTRVARRLRAEDRARRTTSVAPPSS
jgi:hypothetical protein